MTVKLDHPNLVDEPDEQGNSRFYVRVKVHGRIRRARLREVPGTPEFLAAYQAALDALRAGAEPMASKRVANGPVPGSLGWLAAQYFGSQKFRAIDATQQNIRRSVIESCLREKLFPGSKKIMRDCPYKRVDATHVLMLRDRRADEPGAANNRRKYLSAMFGWAIEAKKYGVGSNPCRDVKPIEYATDGYYTWTVDDVRKFVERHPLGTTAYLAFALMLFLGARKGDACRLGPKNMKGGLMTYVPRKTSYKRVEPSVKPILPPLAEAIRRTPIGLKTFIVTEHGQPFSDAGFGNRMREWCNQAQLPECSSHGLKKTAATIVAEMGATDRQMMALFDWESERMASVYTRKANKTKMAADAAALLGTFSWAPVDDAPKSEVV